MKTQNIEALPFVDFSYNWNNKINCKAFTTIRLSNSQKYIVDREYWIRLKSEIKSKAILRAVNHFTIDKLNDFISFLDTGYNAFECKKILRRMYPKVDFERNTLCLILFEQVERVEVSYDQAGIECFTGYTITPWKLDKTI
jgi:hypothetical protein